MTPSANSAVRPIKRTKAYTGNNKEHFWFSISPVYNVHRWNQCWNLIWGEEAFLLKRITQIGRGHTLRQPCRRDPVWTIVMETEAVNAGGRSWRLS